MFGGYLENLYFCTRFRERKVLHPRKRKQRVIDRLIQRKTFLEKSSEKIWSVFEKVLIFASAFTKNESDSYERDL